MRHPTDGVLRRLVDEPAGVAETDRRHVADCTRCLTALAEVRTLDLDETARAALTTELQTADEIERELG